MTAVRAKKHLGQHFLHDERIAEKIAATLTGHGYKYVLEIGPGMGILTQFLVQRRFALTAMDIDSESIAYLEKNFPQKNLRILKADFLKCDPSQLFGSEAFAITGNFPYNISSQIVFRTLEWRHQIPEFTGMFQKEVAQRICEKKGSKTYGILSVLVQAFYEAEFLFTVKPGVFNPPPKVDSGVIRLTRKAAHTLPCSEPFFFQVVKTAFQQRRKTLRNSLKTFGISEKLKEDAIFALRPEQLSVEDFIALTQKLERDGISTH
ncbi:MAG TPA: 16S rRNA (adenine(1518)-N(6)/adenine(1519)-N(6))-dimethyltransferase RsmA [Flavobacteriaceae bacterium]|nr:16S rRNA (adenine(1518)-N(6)/adenine(1519)-N(6))-dimethyltransferase RsmA [Flavobacteriaceae bacterium]MCB9212168.1 16S rRNA (adenine(1518)-N(6)/adenine(1519)-N(6))-dimethyltransferase RsmA [Alteromonas sp.]HPF10454.1 16S rRNA (adenine(1518)-N(6)/adenine(1519)-N(6))-dimethyltransferase RsmA [Flavobacteriaceae bacterium]HQU21763.1 16S rRNA (adenine(1518)-N(6)/adenine(1519)-N(6))-dimethyltransferase RsmA [Flavobacteriaceae bacterium]HQU64665.1 16S rRNA (adenine(1518)-N(6)/adenine(1519)-N(6))-d